MQGQYLKIGRIEFFVPQNLLHVITNSIVVQDNEASRPKPLLQSFRQYAEHVDVTIAI
jgi:hypothetical protein